MNVVPPTVSAKRKGDMRSPGSSHIFDDLRTSLLRVRRDTMRLLLPEALWPYMTALLRRRNPSCSEMRSGSTSGPEYTSIDMPISSRIERKLVTVYSMSMDGE